MISTENEKDLHAITVAAFDELTLLREQVNKLSDKIDKIYNVLDAAFNKFHGLTQTPMFSSLLNSVNSKKKNG